MTEQTTAIHAGRAIVLKSPHACACATSARPTAVVGMTRRTKSVSTTTTPRLLGQRVSRPIACLRRGPNKSPNVIAAKTPPTSPRPTEGSPAKKATRMRKISRLDNDLYLFNYYLELFNISTRPMSRHNPKSALFAQFAAVAKTLGHAHRLELLEQLAQGERSVEVLAQKAGLSIANASQHLQHMRRAGIVANRRDGKFVYYRLADDAVLELLAAL